jgi:hypothetical protein
MKGGGGASATIAYAISATDVFRSISVTLQNAEVRPPTVYEDSNFAHRAAHGQGSPAELSMLLLRNIADRCSRNDQDHFLPMLQDSPMATDPGLNGLLRLGRYMPNQLPGKDHSAESPLLLRIALYVDPRLAQADSIASKLGGFREGRNLMLFIRALIHCFQYDAGRSQTRIQIAVAYLRTNVAQQLDISPFNSTARLQKLARIIAIRSRYFGLLKVSQRLLHIESSDPSPSLVKLQSRSALVEDIEMIAAVLARLLWAVEHKLFCFYAGPLTD